jgi:fibrillarin-like rRNA methylase
MQLSTIQLKKNIFPIINSNRIFKKYSLISEIFILQFIDVEHLGHSSIIKKLK